MIALTVREFSLRHTLECGQFFRWTRIPGGYRVRAHAKTFDVAQKGDRLSFDGAGEGFIKYFFSLDHDVAGMTRELGRDPIVRRAMDEFWGLRLLRQEPYECTLGFIVSICSNIPRITGNVESIARAYGRGGALPGPGVRLHEATLRRLGIGFRAKYLVSAQKRADVLGRIPSLADDAAREALMQIDGVAEKVADCILLFAFGRLGVFPIDTWIRQAMRRLYFDGARVPDREIRAFASARFGAAAGYAQQFLYAWSRRNLKGLPRGTRIRVDGNAQV